MGCTSSKEKSPTVNQTEEEDKPKNIRIVITGQAGVGKTSLISKLVYGEASRDSQGNTADFDVFEKVIKTPSGRSATLLINDTAGQEKFKTITSSFYNRTAGVVLVFDVCDQKSYDSLENWFTEVERYASNASLILIGNKIDLENRCVEKEKGLEYAQNKGISYIETSAITGENVETAFGMIADIILDLE